MVHVPGARRGLAPPLWVEQVERGWELAAEMRLRMAEAWPKDPAYDA
jgi:hypothetical protein